MNSKPSPSTADRGGEVMRTLLADIQLAIEQFSHMSYFYGSYADVDGNSWHNDEKAKKAAKSGAVRKEEVEGRVTLPPPIDNASGFARRPPSDEVSSPDSYRHPLSLGKAKEGQRESELPRNVAAEEGIHPVTQQLLTPQSMKAPPCNRNGLLPGPASPGLPDGISTTTNDGKAQPSARPVMPSTAQLLSPQGVTNVLLSPLSLRDATLFTAKKDRYVHPTDWTVKETTDWLRSEGFDEAVCAKFVEGEIAGYALLNLDVTKLKTEVGIMAYGKRFRIARAIGELRRHARVRSFLTKPPTRAGSSSCGGPPAQQRTRTASNPVPTHSTDVGAKVKPTGRPDPSDDIPKLPPPPTRRDPEPGVRSPVDKPTDSHAKVGPRAVTSPSPTSGKGKGGILKWTSSQLSRTLSDGVLHAKARIVAIGHDARKGERVGSSSHMTKYLAAPHNDHRRSRSPPAVKTSLHASSHQLIEHMTSSPQETTQLDKIHRSRSVGTLGSGLKSHQRYLARIEPGALSDRSPFPLPQQYRGKGTNNNSTTSFAAKGKVPTLPRKHVSPGVNASSSPNTEADKSAMIQGVLVRLGTPDHQGWMRKQGRRIDIWKNRYFVLKDSYLYWLKSDSLLETKVKGYINIVECRIVRAENVEFGRSGFKLLRESDRAHLFSSDDKTLIGGWIEAFLKQLNISTKAVLSSADVPLADTRALNSVPRCGSPIALGATQRTIRRDNADMLSMRDVKLVMGMQSMTSFHSESDKIRSKIRTWRSFSGFEAIGSASPSTSARLQAPVRPSRDTRRNKPMPETNNCQPGMAMSPNGLIYSRPELLRIARSISDIRRPTHFDSVCSQKSSDETFECLSNLVDLLLDKDVKVGVIDTQDMSDEGVDQREKIIRLLRSLRLWEERRREILRSIRKSPPQAAAQEGIANH
ncbi:hypothetical protein BC826DRAFT_89829 [Russula brevipes]|nr:hypothetical protein BC826DRAFT_89829 [Russula brevipes]